MKLALLLTVLVPLTSAGKPPVVNNGDSWTNYTVSGLEVSAVVGGKDSEDYSTVVIMLHGGGGSGEEWYAGRKSAYRAGW